MAAKRAESGRAGADSSHPQALTRRNMRDFNRAERQEEARKKGESTPVTKDSGREYRTSESSPPPLDRDAFQNIIRKYKTVAPGEQVDVNKPLLQQISSEGDRKIREMLEAQQIKHEDHKATPSPGAEQRLAGEKAGRMKITGLQKIAEKGEERGEEQDDAGKRYSGADGPARQQPAVCVQPTRASIRGERDYQGLPGPSRNTSVQPPPGKLKPPKAQATNLASLFPPEFPRFQSVHNVNDIGAYLANASYIVSVGGPPVSDLKYGVVLVPVGEERLLFGRQPDSSASQSLGDAMPKTEEQPRSRPQGAGQPGLHTLDEDSAQFRRPRFATRDHNTGSIASPALQSPARYGQDDTSAISNEDVGASPQGLEHVVNGNSGDVDGDTPMGEAVYSAQHKSAKLAGNPEKRGQGTATTSPTKTQRGSKRTAAKPQGVVKKAAVGTREVPSATENPARLRSLRSRKPPARLGG